MNIIIRFFIKIISMLVPKSKRAVVSEKMANFIFGFKVRKVAKKIGQNFRCGDFCSVSPTTTIGDNVWASGFKIQYCQNCVAEVHIGDYVSIGAEVLILTANHNYNGDTIPFDHSYIEKNVVIKDFAWIASRVTLLPGTTVGEGAIIQAGAVVHGNIPDYAIAGGNPCKVFMMRDEEKFKKLKEQKAFIIR